MPLQVVNAGYTIYEPGGETTWIGACFAHGQPGIYPTQYMKCLLASSSRDRVSQVE